DGVLEELGERLRLGLARGALVVTNRQRAADVDVDVDGRGAGDDAEDADRGGQEECTTEDLALHDGTLFLPRLRGVFPIEGLEQARLEEIAMTSARRASIGERSLEPCFDFGFIQHLSPPFPRPVLALPRAPPPVAVPRADRACS